VEPAALAFHAEHEHADLVVAADGAAADEAGLVRNGERAAAVVDDAGRDIDRVVSGAGAAVPGAADMAAEIAAGPTESDRRRCRCLDEHICRQGGTEREWH